MKFNFDILKPLCTNIFDHWWKVWYFSEYRKFSKEFISNWWSFHTSYEPWNLHHTIYDLQPIVNDNSPTHETHPLDTMNLNDWELLSKFHPTNDIFLNYLELLAFMFFMKTTIGLIQLPYCIYKKKEYNSLKIISSPMIFIRHISVT